MDRVYSKNKEQHLLSKKALLTQHFLKIFFNNINRDSVQKRG